MVLLFLLTGDIPAMWLRDSTAQMRPYLVLAEKDEAIRNLIAGLVRKQMYYINLDPYANALMKAKILQVIRVTTQILIVQKDGFGNANRD